MRLQGFNFFLCSTFIYELVLIKIYMNANINKTQIIHQYIMTSNVIKGHKMSYLVAFILKLQIGRFKNARYHFFLNFGILQKIINNK